MQNTTAGWITCFSIWMVTIVSVERPCLFRVTGKKCDYNNYEDSRVRTRTHRSGKMS